jgi:hypothetical protein
MKYLKHIHYNIITELKVYTNKKTLISHIEANLKKLT